MQKWEYFIIYRKREVKQNGFSITLKLGEYRNGILLGKDTNSDFPKVLQELGLAGWELITVVANSDEPGTQAGGATTSEKWVFKRPKE